MPSSRAVCIRRIAVKIRRLPDKFAQPGFHRSWDKFKGMTIHSWVVHEGARLLLKAFEAGAFGGPATPPPASVLMKIPTTKTASIEQCQKATEEWERQRHKELSECPGPDATYAEQRAYVGKCLAGTWCRKPRMDVHRDFVPGDFINLGWTLLLWMDITNVFVPDAPRDYDKAELRARMEATAVANAIEAEASLVESKTATSHAVGAPLTESQQQAFELICNEGPLLGRQIVNRLGIGSESTFTTHYVPALKKHGIKNKRGLGYYHPDYHKPK